MTESHDWNDSLLEAEAMVRAAGQYVGVSDDLRPRVLEAARLQCGERRAKRFIRHLAVSLLVLTSFTAAGRDGFEMDKSRPSLVAARFDELFALAAVPATRSGDGDWRMFDAFTELRRQQAQVFRLAL